MTLRAAGGGRQSQVVGREKSNTIGTTDGSRVESNDRKK